MLSHCLKGNVQNVTPIPTPEHKFRPKGSSQQSKPSDEFETKPVMEAAPAATEEKPVAKPESNQQDDDSDSFVSPSFGGFKNPYADEELEEKPEKKPEAKDTEKKTVKPKVAVKSHKGGNVILGVSCVVLAASVVVMGMTIAESRKSDSIVYPSTGSALNISADVATTDTNFENQEALTPVVSMTSDGNTWTLSSSTFLITDGESKVAVAVDSADSIKYDGAALQYERNGVTYLVRMVSDSSYLGNSTMTEHEDGATHMITGIEGMGSGLMFLPLWLSLPPVSLRNLLQVISIKVTLSWLPVLCPAILTRIRTVKIVRSTPYGLTKHLLQVAAKTLLRTALLLLQQLPLRLLLLLHRLTVNMGQMNSMRLKRTICPSNHQF